MTTEPSVQKESEHRLDLAMSQAPLLMWTTDVDLRFTSGTGAPLTLLGLDTTTFRGKSVGDFFPGEGEDAPLSMHRRALAGRSVQYEYAWMGRWFDVRLEPIRGQAGAILGVIGVALDFTERRQTEESLRLSEERFTLLGRATNDMAWDWDIETDGMWRNEALETVFGYSAEDMEPVGAWWEHHIHPDDRERAVKSIRSAVASGAQSWSAEYRWRRKDGTYATVLDRGHVLRDEAGNPIRMVGSTMDVTKARREEKVREAIYRISEAAAASKDLAAFYADVHKVVGQLMPAQNFYIALYDEETKFLSFPYFVDEEESVPEPYQAGRGLTEYVLRSGQPFYASTEGYEKLVASGEVVRVGPPSIDWVGVPLIAHGRTLGALVLQTYTEGVRYGDAERDILSYVSEQIAMAIERLRTQDALRSSEENYRMLFEANPTPMWVYDLETLRFLAVNDIAVAHYGYSREEFLSMSIKDIRPPEYVPALIESVRASRSAIQHSGTWKHRAKDGHLMDVEITSHTITLRGRPAVLVLAADVTERLQAQQALAAAEAKFRSLVEQSLTGICIVQEGQLRYANPRFAEIFGYAPEEIIGVKRALDLAAPEDSARAQETLRQQETGEVADLHWFLRGLRKDGGIVDLEVHGSQTEFDGHPAVIGSVLDVTERHLSEEGLRRSETRFRTLFEAAADAILLVNRKGLILDANPAAGELVERERTELAGTALEGYLQAEDLERSRAYLRRCFRDPTPSDPFEVTILTAKGHARVLAVRSRLVSEPTSAPYVEMVIRDVTEQREMQRRLLASERLASVGQMATYIAHEINTPLANISLLAAASKRRTKEPEVVSRLEKIDAQRRQAAAIITDLLSFTKHREIQAVDIDLRTVVLGAVDQIDPYRREEVGLALDLGESPAPAHVDPVQMQEVLVNLLRNAFEATARGTVTVRLQARPGMRVISVADTGHGIPQDVRGRLFQPFVSTKRAKGGTGLGLALCRNIVTAHGGEILFTTEVDKGTTFTVTIPQVDST